MNLRATLTRLGASTVADLARAASKPTTREVLRDQLNDAAQQVFSVSQRYVPVDTGYLKGSGHIEFANVRVLTSTVSYNTDYALAVHETHRSKSGYLTRAVDVVWDNLPDDVANAIVREFT